jgi:glutathione S-transferase
MVDPNKGVTLFESGAIVEYLVATYDEKCKLIYQDVRLEEKVARSFMGDVSDEWPGSDVRTENLVRSFPQGHDICNRTIWKRDKSYHSGN